MLRNPTRNVDLKRYCAAAREPDAPISRCAYPRARQPKRHGWHERTWQLARAIWPYLYGHGYQDDCIAIFELALRSADSAGDLATAGLAHNYLAGSYFRWGQTAKALEHVEQAITTRLEAGDRSGAAGSIVNRGRVLMRAGRYPEALESFRHALRIRLSAGDPPIRIGDVYINIGQASVHLGDYATAEKNYRRHLAIADGAGSDVERAVALHHLGSLELLRGRPAAAVELLERATQLYCVDDLPLHAELVSDLGSAYRDLGDLERALRHQRDALSTMQRSDAVYGECDVRIELAVTLHLAGDDDEALDHLHSARDIAARLNLAPQLARVLDGLAAIPTAA